ncbi:MAG: HAD family phosphatase [Atopobiaceae bacterium]|nr:HAD family phosphatase [Atopobiaceae bacterium]
MSVIFFDIDGTLAVGKKVPQSAADAIARTREAHNQVFICTGRPRRYVEQHFGDYADGFVCSNGRLAFHNGSVLVNKPIAPNQVEHIVHILDERNAGYAFFSQEELYYGGNESYRHVAEEANGPTKDLAQAYAAGTSLYSFDIYFAVTQERDAIATALADLCLVNPHGPHPSADVTVLGYGKGDAARDVTKALGLAHGDSYAFGDGINDLSMVEAVAHGVAMGNAVDELKEVAEFVTYGILEDGVAHGLAHYGLA